MEHQILVKAPCKINLFLEVDKRRSDGYHNIDTIMQAVGLYDQVAISYDSKGEGISLDSNKKNIPLNENNIACKAAKLFLEKIGVKGGLRLFLQKQIPIGAGLGGGSTDGAAVLKGLNTLFDGGFSIRELCDMGATLGADIPFCVRGGSVRATGIGELMENVPSLSGFYPVIAIGTKPSSTKVAYERLDEIGHTGKKSAASMVKALKTGNRELLLSELYNAFEEVIFPENEEAAFLKKEMMKRGALGALMSGSGASVFGLFETEKEAITTQFALRDAGFFSVFAPIKEEEN